ncbi:RlpA-like protein precursor [Vibrio thalassae]|uniref:Endolytic peptidoglycan transglycosylase RlpA n=1 Tax=Vibrio thalassae TaxID=1243014 RepID=A0A240ERE6_9VIBR|nr:septal ring lytic transglycosylase RlpA family protein [Vibrio thalassae]SNX50810.1 RlpA-like protein precursor [Vibrio thalassae]
MKTLSLVLTTLLITLLGGCASTAAIDSQKTQNYSKAHQLVGQASWYGNQYHGKRTASGERYNMRAYTAAHKTLPFGTIVRVTNTANGKTVDVKINDRGPFVKGRVIDLSRQSFEQIASISKGIAPVKIDIIDDSNTFRYKH